MNEPRIYASLSSGLLARKGTAKPAMRPQGFTGFEDLGWNDMGYGREEGPEPNVAEHVPSSIAALTPAPKDGPLDSEVLGDENEEFTEPEEFSNVEEFSKADEYSEAGEYSPAEEFAGPEAGPAPEEVEALQSPAHSVVAQQRAILEQYDGEEEHDGEEEPEAAFAPIEAAEPPRRVAKAKVVPLPKRVASVPVIAGRKAAFTLRLDVQRHLRLRLACAVTGRSAQHIVAGALDSALAEIPEIEALAARVPAGAKRN
ncbi:MAG: hypothetical protein ACXWU2_11300 [Allosphingosinicella sp.]